MSKKIIVQGGIRKGGYEFNVLETPAIQTYEVNQLKRFEINSDLYWHGYISGKEIKSKKFPIDANPRKPGPTKVVKLMQATIQKEPENFHHLNNGITIIAHKVKFDSANNSIEIEYGSTKGIHGDGICNGGHSYFAIEQYSGPIDECLLVRIEILVLDPNLSESERAEKIKVIAEARNSHNELESITTAHYSGYYDKLIETLGTDKIFFKWYEGDPDAIKNADKVDTLIAKLTAICPHWYSHYLNHSGHTGNHLSSARSHGTTHKKWQTFALNSEDERNLDYMLPLTKDMLLLKDEISHSLLHDDFPQVTKRWRSSRIWLYLNGKDPVDLIYKKNNGKKTIGYNLSHTFATMVLGAFRENVWFSYNDEGVNLVGWLKDPIALWHDHKEDFMKDLNNIASTINAQSFGNAFLQNPAIYSYQFTRYQFGARLRQFISEPEIIYDTDTFQKYIKCEPGHSDFQLHTEIVDEELPPFAELKESNEKELTCYKLQD